MKNKHLIMIESNHTGIKSLEKLLSLGVKITFITSNKDFYTRLIPGANEAFEKINIIEIKSTYDDKILQQACDEIKKNFPINGVLTFNDSHIVHAAKLAALYGLPGVNVKAVSTAHEKPLTRECLNSAELNQPKFLIAKSKNEIIKHVKTMGYPCVLKISNGCASLGVSLVANNKMVNDYIAELEENNYFDNENHILIESYEEGEVVSVESMVTPKGIHPLGIHDRILTAFPNFIEVGLSYLSQHPAMKELLALNYNVINALGIDHGFVHNEFILGNKGPLLLESNCRLAGACAPELMELSSGVDPQIQAARLALNYDVLLPIATDKLAIGHYFGSPSVGELISIESEEAMKIKYINKVEQCFLKGHIVKPMKKSNADVIGCVIASNSDKKSLLNSISAAISKIRINISTHVTMSA